MALYIQCDIVDADGLLFELFIPTLFMVGHPFYASIRLRTLGDDDVSKDTRRFQTGSAAIGPMDNVMNT